MQWHRAFCCDYNLSVRWDREKLIKILHLIFFIWLRRLEGRRKSADQWDFFEILPLAHMQRAHSQFHSCLRYNNSDFIQVQEYWISVHVQTFASFSSSLLVFLHCLVECNRFFVNSLCIFFVSHVFLHLPPVRWYILHDFYFQIKSELK